VDTVLYMLWVDKVAGHDDLPLLEHVLVLNGMSDATSFPMPACTPDVWDHHWPGIWLW
jgi:hypothetical protein